jgi:hypothetical protein
MDPDRWHFNPYKAYLQNYLEIEEDLLDISYLRGSIEDVFLSIHIAG